MRDYAGLFQELLADLGPGVAPDVPMSSDMGAQFAARVALASSFYKKLAPDGNTRRADDAALIKFEAINSSMSTLPFEFEAENEAESCFWDYFLDIFQRCLEPHESLGTFDLDFIREHMATGPGASQKADSSYMVSKLFESSMSYVNPDLVAIYRAALSGTRWWAEAERLRFQKFGFVRVLGGKLFFAPKNSEISRTCCTEASLEMLIQKAVGAFLEKRAEWFFGISLKTQPVFNRELARLGSIDGSFGTIDLISASDSIANALMIRALPNSFLKGVIRMSRSESAVLPDGRLVPLRMVSTMGNGFTFPLQTIIFASAVRAVYQLMGFPCVSPRTQFGVFGDDIVVRREAYSFVCRMLAKLGFGVNVSKSFNTGPFRESCGHDYYDGHNVRGVYVRSLETPQNVYSTLNRLVRWSVLHGTPLRRVVNLLRSWVRDMRVPPSEADDSGLKVPWKLSGSTSVDNRYWFKYRRYVRRTTKLKVPDIGAGEGINPIGIALGYLSGHIRRRELSYTSTESQLIETNLSGGLPAFTGFDYSVSVSLRDRVGARARYKISASSLPYWDYWPDFDANSQMDRNYEWSVPLAGAFQSAWEGALVDLVR